MKTILAVVGMCTCIWLPFMISEFLLPIKWYNPEEHWYAIPLILTLTASAFIGFFFCANIIVEENS